MRPLQRELRDAGYERTEKASPFDDDGTLWTNSYELVCDITARVIRNGEQNTTDRTADTYSFERHRYHNSNRVRMMGGYLSSYDWNIQDGRIEY